LKKSFWNIAAKLTKRVKHEWQKKRDFGEDEEEARRIATDKRKTTIAHLPSLLPLLTDF